MSPKTLGPNDILREDNYFLWEFNARMALAHKDLLDHVMAVKPEQAMVRETAQWKAADLKALAVLSKLLSPTYQTMIREATSAFEAWETLRNFVHQNLHNRVQLRKELHEFRMVAGGNLMEHLLRFDDLCLRLSAAGDKIDDDEKLVVLLGSLPTDYDSMVKIIESKDAVEKQDPRNWRLKCDWRRDRVMDPDMGTSRSRSDSEYDSGDYGLEGPAMDPRLWLSGSNQATRKEGNQAP